MSLSTAQTLRTSPYALPPPGSAGRLTTVSRQGGGPYAGPNSFSSQLQPHYNFGPQSQAAATGFSFQSSMFFPGSQPPPPPPPPPPPSSGASLPPTTSGSSMPLPDSPSQDTTEGILPQSTVPRRLSVSSHGSPIPPSSPILEEEPSADHYKISPGCFRPGPPSGPPPPPPPPPPSISAGPLSIAGPPPSIAGPPPSIAGPPSISMGMNSAFNSFPTPQPTSLPMPGVGYPHSQSAGICHTSSLYGAQDGMCPSGAGALGLPMWNYSAIGGMGGMSLSGNSMTKLSLDTPRYKLTPERAVPLIKWFEDHKEHPYPTRHEKMLLCQSTQLTYTQVSTWFANARRRMKKANSEEEERSNHSSSDECASQGSLDSPHRSS